MSRLGRHWIHDHLPLVLLNSYKKLDEVQDGVRYIRNDGMTVIMSGAVELDGRKWIHLSCAHPHHLPSWADVMEVKRLFIGDDMTALQVIPRREKHVNIHTNCLHLWACVDGDVTPDFTRGSGSI